MTEIARPIAGNNNIFRNTCSNDSRAIYLSDRGKISTKSTGYYIFLGPSVHIVIHDEKIFDSVRMALHNLHLYSFVCGGENVPQKFLDLIRNPLQFDKDNVNTYHPLILYLTGILNISMSLVTTELSEISPINLILKRLHELSILGGNSSHMHKRNMLLRYNVLQGLETDLLLSAFYDLVNGNESFFLLTRIILAIDSIFSKQITDSILNTKRNNDPFNLLSLQQLVPNNINPLDMDKEINPIAFNNLWTIQSSNTAISPWDMESNKKHIFPKADTLCSFDTVSKNELHIEKGKLDCILQGCTNSILGNVLDKSPCNDLVSHTENYGCKMLDDSNSKYQENSPIFKNTCLRAEDNISDVNNVHSVFSNSINVVRDENHNRNTTGLALGPHEGNTSQSSSRRYNYKGETSKETNSQNSNEYNTSSANSLNQQRDSNISGNRDDDDDNDGDNKKNHFNKFEDNNNTGSDSESESEAESVFESESNSMAAFELNKIRIDKEENDVVEMLADLFPVYPRSELVARAKSTNDVGNIIDGLFLEQEEQTKLPTKETEANYSRAVCTLKEIFPEYKFEVLQKILDENGGDVTLATADILNDKPEEKISAKNSKTSLPIKTQNDAGQPQSSWMAVQTDASRLEDILDIPSQQILGYLHNHEGKFHETLIAIINDNSVRISNASSGTLSSSRSSLASFSKHVPRVQGPSSKPTTPVPDMRWRSASPEDPYTYDENSLEAKEIRAIYVGNPEFNSINEKFFEKALVFFRGDVAKVIEVAALLVQDRAGRFTFKLNSSAPSYSGFPSHADNKKKHPIISLSATHYKPSHLRSSSPTTRSSLSGSDSTSSTTVSVSRSPTSTDEVSLKNQRLKSATKTNTLDLHNLTVPVAIEATGQALRDWWKDELDQRHMDGNLTRFGSRAQFVSSLNLITGRGIHSQGGKARIRIAVKNYLHGNNYVFEEYSGRFEIEGKR